MEFNALIGAKKTVFIIAEIGQNHQGEMQIAKQMIKIAKEHGADCVKFQKTNLQEKFNKGALQRPYTSPNSWGITYGDHKAYLEFSNEEFIELQKFAQENDILFSASAMDSISLNFLVDLGVPFIKIGSGDANNFLLIEEAASKNVPLIVSTGMQDFATVKQIYQTISKYHKKFALLHCISSYPTPVEDINLSIISRYKKEFPDIAIGYSGHELGTVISVGAVVLGASVSHSHMISYMKYYPYLYLLGVQAVFDSQIVERHLTLDKNQRGSDHKCSLDPMEFRTMVDEINIICTALGKPVKEIKECEMECYRKLRKTIVASKIIPAGSILKKEDVKIKVAQPLGIDGSLIEQILGETVTKQIDVDEPLTEDYFKKLN